jgi:hypothetical protein
VKHGQKKKDGAHRKHDHRNHDHQDHHESARHDADHQPVITAAVTGSAEVAPGSIVEVVTGMQVGPGPTEGDV